MLSICRISSPIAGRESWQIVLQVSGSLPFRRCHRRVCWVLFCSSACWKPIITYIDDSTQLQPLFASKYTCKPAVTAYINRYLARIPERCNRWCMILNKNKNKTLFVRRSSTVNPDFWLVCVSIHTCSKLDIFDVKFDSKLSLEDHVRGIENRLSEDLYSEVGDACVCRHLYYFVAMMHLCCQFLVLFSFRESYVFCHFQYFEHLVHSVERLCSDQG